MAFAHNAMLRGLNAIYLQAPHISPEDVPDFQFFIASWASWVLHHHTIEETKMFPAFELVRGVALGSLQNNVKQHHEFADGLSTLHNYAEQSSPTLYSGVRVQSLIDGFAKVLRQHLADEIDTLWAMDSVEQGTEHSEKLLEIYQHCEKEASKQDKHVVPPMVLGLCDKTFEGGNDWPKMPLGSAYFVHYIFGRKHRGSWRFLPCDSWRNPKPLQFVGSANRTR
jgi:hemerythrin-like domain-containing protein